MLSRLYYAMKLRLLRFGEWVNELSPAGRGVLLAMVWILFMLAAYFGLLPSKHLYDNRHALFSW